MQKSRFCVVFLAFWLVTVFFRVEVAHGYDNFTLQSFLTTSTNNYIGFLQGISGYNVQNFSESGKISVNFTNVTVSGLHSASYGLGSFKNLGTLTFLNIQPDLEVAPALFSGEMFTVNNKVDLVDYNYSVNLNFNGFQGSGIIVLNLLAGSFCNQFTSVHISMGRNVTPEPSNLVARYPEGESTLVQLSNAQMETMAATANNEFKILGKQSAIATVEGTPEIQGICAITLSSGVNNMVSHRVGINIDTSK
ncbi:MAG: hypothetical protein P8X65_02200 [Syntrophobacterales bacterium]|jgi:hypothetical protein